MAFQVRTRAIRVITGRKQYETTCGNGQQQHESINDYGFGKNVIGSMTVTPKFIEELPEQKTYEYVDSTYQGHNDRR